MRVCLLSAFILGAVSTLLHADDAVSPRTVAVTGTAVMRTVPDIINWHISLQDKNQNLLDAKEASDAKVTKILALREKLRVNPGDMQTGQLHISKEYNRDRAGNQLDFKHFSVSRSLTIKQRDVKKFDEFVTTLLTASEMEVSFSFESSRFHELRSDTRLKALQLAKEKAKAMTEVLDAKLGKVLTIEEDRPKNPYASPLSNSMYFDPGSAAPIDASEGTFAPGAIEVRVSVNVVFEIVD